MQTTIDQGIMYNWRVSCVHKLLRERGKGEGKLSLRDLLDLGHLDQYHYLGEKTSFELVDLLELNPQKHVLDIGSGAGGTARVMAHESGCQVTALEVQAGLNEMATTLTKRLGIGDQVKYLTADFNTHQFEHPFDHFISLLVFLHLPNRAQTLARAYDALKDEGTFVIEDLVLIDTPTPEVEKHLKETLHIQSITDSATYLSDLEKAGFEILSYTDHTPEWTTWTRKRYENFAKDQSSNESLYGKEVFAHRTTFYRAVADFFAEGTLGGLRVVGKK